MTTSFSKDAAHFSAQETAIERLKDKYSRERKLELDKLGEPVIWARDAADAVTLVRSFMMDEQLRVNFLSDLTAYDNCDEEDGPARFVLVYQVYSVDLKIRVRIKTLLAENTEAKTLCDVFPAANWLEREVFDLYGIRFQGHPNLRRIMMDERFEGYPLRKDYAMKNRQPFKDNVPLHLGGHPLHVENTLEEGEK